MAQSFFVQSSTVGVDLNNANATALFGVGTHCLGTQNSEWVYVQANTSINGLSMVAINTAFTCGMASGGDVVAGLQLASAHTSISSQAFGWVALRGANLTILVTGTGSAGGVGGQVALGASAITTGVLDLVTVGTASCTLIGVQLQVTASGSASSGVGLFTLTWPKAANPLAGG